ncbi:MAG: homoserine O-succinyltransferase [Phascolarctobacterium sp.]|nr:homoserine O-succinyltransferase [Phascolarctobacterium sp.]
MSIMFDTRLEAAKVLASEGIEVVDKFSEKAKKLNPIKICIFNLLPEKPAAETQWLRGLSFSEYDIEVTFAMLESHKPTHTSQEYLDTFYTNLTKLQNEFYDGLIITGADAEKYEFEKVKYWPEMEKIFAWADTHVKSCYFSCWGCMAALYHYYGIDKHLIGPKLSGIYAHTKPNPEHILLTNQPATIYVPHSRISGYDHEELRNCKEVTVLADADGRVGPTLSCCDAKKHVYVIAHWEYEPEVLQSQYIRDTSKGFDMQKPENYFDENDNIRQDQDWISQFHTMMANWVRYYIVG